MLGFRPFFSFLGWSYNQGTGSAPPPPPFVPKLDFSDARNSQYTGVVL